MKILVQSSLKLKGTHKYQVLSYPNTFTLMTWDWFVMFWPWFLCHQWTCFCDVASITYVVCIVHSSQIILYEPRSMGLSVHLHTVFRNFGCLQFGPSKTQSRCDLDLQNLKDGKTVMSMYLMKIDSLSARKEEIQREMRYHYYACVQRSWTNAGTIPPNFLHQIETVQPLCWKRWKQLPSLVRSSRLRGDAFNCTSNTNRCISRARKHCSRNPVDSGLENTENSRSTWKYMKHLSCNADQVQIPLRVLPAAQSLPLESHQTLDGLGASWENKLCA